MSSTLRYRSFLFLLGLLSFIIADAQQQSFSVLETKLRQAGLVDVNTLDKTIHVNLKYATTDNFTNTVLYDTLSAAYLHPVAAEKLVKAQRLLKQINSEYNLLIYDAARPLSVQKKMYKVVQGTSRAAYVANPAKIGMHNYGLAVDLTICKTDGTPLDMGTAFDFFGRAAAIRDEEGLIRQGKLNRKQVDNRKLLRKVMLGAGFLSIKGEWWHFNATTKSDALRNFKVIK